MAALRMGTFLLAAGLLLAGCTAQAPGANARVVTIDRAEAQPAGWDSVAPRAEGWTQVSLRDTWSTRWPHHDGVVWYRLHWQQDDATKPTGLLLDSASIAAVVYVNGSLVASDPSLREPLSRTWHTPRYFLLQAPLLRQGENTVLVRVSGLVAYGAWMDQASVGDPAVVASRFRRAKWLRHDLQLIDTVVSAVLGAVFLLFWLLRRRDSVYGWFALNTLLGMGYGLNFIATSPWPFRDTDGWQAFNAALLVASVASYLVFLLRFAGRRWPRVERALLIFVASGFIAALAFPHAIGPARDLWAMPPVLVLHYGALIAFSIHAFRNGSREAQVLAACMLLPVPLSLHDVLLYLGAIHGETYLSPFASPLMVAGMGFVLAHRFVGAMTRVEGFNRVLEREVGAATSQLADTLNRQHALELAHSRAGERLQLVRDLHDGFGGSLIGAIARIEEAPERMPPERVVVLLKGLRDDLRLVIDSTAREHADLAQLLVPLRHRASQLLDTAGIRCAWRMQDLDGVELGSARSLDFLRLLQEALTNVFKHSRARSVEIAIARESGRLRLCVRDDGVGPGPGDANGERSAPRIGDGAGLASMRLRAQRLGGELRMRPAMPGTELSLEFPLAA